MTAKKKKAVVAAAVILLLLVVDQLIKIWVKTHMTLGEQIVIAPWFRIEFIENKGMAWGMELGSKLFLSLFRIVAVIALVWYIQSQIRKNCGWGFLIMLCMICAARRETSSTRCSTDKSSRSRHRSTWRTSCPGGRAMS